MDLLYALLGLLLVAHDAVNNFARSAASSVSGGGVLAALVLATIAMVMAHHADDRAEELARKLEQLEEKLEEREENEERQEDW